MLLCIASLTGEIENDILILDEMTDRVRREYRQY